MALTTTIATTRASASVTPGASSDAEKSSYDKKNKQSNRSPCAKHSLPVICYLQ